ncbi:hypothetical protein HY380_01650 [Candidatus Saccharibacteria bacterium]|nr:hypothetical protein [Candidatus Saccharibacteria bacterium]
MMSPNQPGRRPQPKFFDVSHPQHRRPSPTSRPLIVGHHPQAADPMVHQRPSEPQVLKPVSAVESAQPVTPTLPPEPPAPEPSVPPQPQPQPQPQPPLPPSPPAPNPPAEPEPPAPDNTSAEGSSLRYWRWIVLALIAAFIGAYLVIDSGLIKTNINLPFHLFKQNQPAATSSSNQTTSPLLAQGWTTYEDKRYGFKFNYPEVWGDPELVAKDGTAVNSSGKSYQLTFNPGPQYQVTKSQTVPSREWIFIQFDSEGLKNSSQNQSGQAVTTGPAETSQAIEADLAAITKDKSLAGGEVIDSDQQSYTLLSAGEGAIDSISVKQIVSLPSLDVSAAHIDYNVYINEDPKACAASSLSAQDTPWCVTPDVVDVLQIVIASLAKL